MCETLREPVKVLKSLSEQAINKQYKFKRLYRNLYNPEFYFLAYKNISQSQGSMTSGVDGKSLDGMSEKRISALIESIRSFSYQPNPARRVYIEKKNSTKKRPLGIPSTEDKLVQEVVKMILESIYEPNFSDCSHGFRPKRSCHSALQQIQNQFTGITWFVEGDIHACFDSFDHHVLVNILRERIEDENFLALIWKMLKAGYMEQWAYNCTFSGTPQGSGVSPILANIYLSKLDDFAENLKKSFNKGKSKENLEYQRAASKLYYIRRKNRANWENWNEQQRKEALRLQKDAINYMHSLPSKRANNKEYKSLVYCRYADDFLIGVIGSFEDASEIKEKFRVFLEDTLHLEMSEEKTKITHSQDKARFLGYDITTAKNSALKYDSKHQLRKTHTGRIKLYAPRDKWQGKLTEYGALRIRYDKNGKEIWDSHHRGNMVHMESAEPVPSRMTLLKCRNGIDQLEDIEKSSLSGKWINQEVAQAQRKAELYLDNRDTEVAYCLGDVQRYFFIQTGTEGYDYTIYDAGFKEIDGGIFDNMDVSMEEAVTQILDDYGLAQERREVIDCENFLDKVQEAEVTNETIQMAKPSFQNPRTLAEELDQFQYDNDFYEFQDQVENRETHIKEIEELICDGKTNVIQGWLQNYIEENNDQENILRAEQLLRKIQQMPAGIEDVPPIEEAKITFYAAECMEFPVFGEYHDNLTLADAYEKYKAIPSERIHGIKGIGFRLEDGSMYDGEYELMRGGVISKDLIDLIPHYKESPLVQKAVSDLETMLLMDRQEEAEKHQSAGRKIDTGEKNRQPVKQKTGAKQSVLQALKERQERIKSQNQKTLQKTEKKTQGRKKGEPEL